MGSYAILLAFSIWLNRRNGKMLFLTMAVGFGIFFPVPEDNVYLICTSIEILVAVAADLIDATASRMIIWLSIALSVFHFLGWQLDGWPPESPYHILVIAAEHAEIIACILLSDTFTKNKKADNV